MTVVLVVVIVLLLVLLSAGTVVTVRRRQADADGAAPAGLRRRRAPEAGAEPPSRPTGVAGAEPGAPPAGEVVGPPGSEAARPEAPVREAAEPGAALAEEAAAGAGPPRLRDRLGRARDLFGSSLAGLRSRGRVDEAAFEDLEEALLLADVGLPTAGRLLDALREQVRAGQVEDSPDAMVAALRADIAGLFDGEDRSLGRAAEGTTVWLFVGVNGVGKTTTIGKLAAAEARAGRRVVLAAGDTFRAAAGEQLELWAERSGAGIVRGAEGADPSSVIFDAVQHAAARGADLVLADTAGRLHTKVNLMDELAKVRRIADRPPGHVSEVLLVLDATTGQNGLVQARQFAEAVDVTGVVLTKLDGTAKGGIVLAIRAELGLPIKLVGLGEGAADLVAFDPEDFVSALFE
ncbi:MAG TPA: signal recognition particle-docking protein FtsY [Acidimicrobiales bacterium]|nr:signal recognition particle-docking protein FtsY [Acidimicrobiales bacterium]